MHIRFFVLRQHPRRNHAHRLILAFTTFPLTNLYAGSNKTCSRTSKSLLVAMFIASISVSGVTVFRIRIHFSGLRSAVRVHERQFPQKNHRVEWVHQFGPSIAPRDLVEKQELCVLI